MKASSIVDNLRNKSPKILLIIVLMFGLGFNGGSMFGYNISNKRADEKSFVAFEDAVERYFDQKVSLKSDDGVMFDVEDGGGEIIGYVIWSDSFSQECPGYGGRTPMAIFLDKDQYIRSVQLLQSNESGRFVARLQSLGFFASWDGHHVLDRITNPDAVSGATFTSRAVIANVDAALSYIITSRRQSTQIDWSAVYQQLIVLGVVILSLVCFFFPARTKRLRIPSLIISVVVLGIWQGTFLSIDLLYNWLIHGVSLTARFAMIAIVIISLLAPLLFSRSYYCTHLCPFGALQELIGRLNPHKFVVPAKILLVFRWIRQAFLVAVIVLLFVNPHFEPSEIEPFTVFMIRSAAVSVIVIAAIGLVTSIFVQRAWCRLFCPTGEILSFLQRKIRWRSLKKQ